MTDLSDNEEIWEESDDSDSDLSSRSGSETDLIEWLRDFSTFDNMEQEQELEQMPENAEQEEKRWSKRTQLMQNVFETAFGYQDTLSFKDMARNLNRKQAASRFYTLLVLKKHQAICTEQSEPFGDIYISRGPHFGIAC